MGIVTINIFDTARAYSFLQRIPSIDQISKDGILENSKRINYLSLEKLVKMLLGINMDKFY